MPFGPGGVFSAISLPDSFNPATTGGNATPEAWNALLADLTSDGLTQVITKNGLTTPTANLPLGGFRWTGVGDATARTMFASAGQVQDGGLTSGTVGGTADVITVTLSPALTAYKVNQTFVLKAPGTNTTNVTVNVNGIGAGPLVWPNGTALAAGDIVSGAMIAFTVADITTSTAPVLHLQTVSVNPVTSARAAAGNVYQQVFTANGTYTPHAGMVNCIIECIGGGGAGGGTNGALSQVNVGSGGGSGSYSRKLATASDIGASKAVTVGAGGTAGAAGPNAGGNGADTSVGTLCIGKGGTGGGGTDAGVSVGAAGAGGVAGTGNVTAAGASGNAGFTANTTAISVFGAAGGSSIFGGGAAPSAFFGTGSANGAAASAYGSGGGGGYTSNVAANVTGGVGTSGIVIVTEFCNQ